MTNLKEQTETDTHRIQATIEQLKKTKVKRLDPIPNYEKKRSDWCAECEN